MCGRSLVGENGGGCKLTHIYSYNIARVSRDCALWFEEISAGVGSMCAQDPENNREIFGPYHRPDRAAPAALFERAMKPKQLSPQAVQGRRTCVVCRLRLNEPLKARLIEQRLALGASVNELARETGIERHGLTRHYQKHCDQKAILREVHNADRDATVAELFARANIEDRSPLRVCDQQIAFYIAEFEKVSRSGDREARDQADKRLFTWTKLKHQVVTPLSQQYGPVTNNVQNNTIIAAGTDLGALVALMEAKLARRPPEERRQIIGLLREIAAGDGPLKVTALVDASD
jgi:hypothetical protein